jgi:cell division protein FtsL
MTRLNLVLLLAVIASALFLVRTQYESRRLFAELDRARVDARRLASNAWRASNCRCATPRPRSRSTSPWAR